MENSSINSLISVESLEEDLKSFLSDPETTHDLKTAVSKAHEILNHNDKSSYAHYTLALNEVAYANKLAPLSNFDPSIKRLKSIIEMDPNFLEAYLMLAKLYKDSDKQKEFEILNEANKKFPDNFLIMYDLANIKLHTTGEKNEAVDLFSKCVQKLPQIANNWGSLGTAYLFTRELEMAKTCFETALSIEPDHVPSILGIGVYHYENANFEEAKKFYQESLKIDGGSYYGNMNLAYLELLIGDQVKGHEMYEKRDKNHFLKKYGGSGFKEMQKINTRKNSNEKLIILNEQGFGDDIMFSRYLKPLVELGYKPTMMEQPELIDLMKLSPDLDGIEIRSNLPECDPNTFKYRTFLLSLPYIMGDFLKKKPDPLFIDSKRIIEKDLRNRNKINNTLTSKKFKVGFSWSGNPKHHRHFNRSIELTKFSEIFDNHDIEFFAIQKGINPVDKKILKNYKNVKNCDDLLADFLHTAYLVSKMDMIISVDTSLVHLSGSMKKETKLLLPKVPDWRWGVDSKQEWYPSVENFRQTTIDDWSDPINKIKKVLNERVS